MTATARPPVRTRVARLISLLLAGSWSYWATGSVIDFDRFAWWAAAAQAFSLYAFLPVALGLVLGALQRSRPIVVTAVVGLLVLGALHQNRVRKHGQPTVADSETVTVMALNLNQGRASVGEVADLVAKNNVDVLVVPELTPPTAKAFNRVGLTRRLPNVRLNPWWGSGGLGVYSRFPLRAPSLMVEGASKRLEASANVGSTRLTIVAVHAVPPRSSLAASFQYDLKNYPETSARRPTLLAGDFNATLSDERMRNVLARGYRDAAQQRGKALAPTWRRGLAALTIDHILVPPGSAVSRYETYPVRGTDHRAVLSTFLLPQQ